MPYLHGVYIYEDPTPVIAPLYCDSAIQVVVGTAPVNMAQDISGAVNKPILVNSFTEAVKRVGYSDNFSKYTLCQSIDASFRVFNIAPVILINVLDPAKHSSSAADKEYALYNRKVTVGQDGVLRDSVEVKGDGAALRPGIDFNTAFDDLGNLVIFTDTDYNRVSVSYNYLDPSKVTALDIIGGYNAQTGEYNGLELIEQIFPRLSVIPGQILAPGWSQIPAVNAVITSKLTNINMCFKCTGVSDIDTSQADTYDKVNDWKNKNGYVNENLVVCWPKVQVGAKVYFYSAVWAALTAYVDTRHENVPYKSPSNELARITGTVAELSDVQPAVLQDPTGTVNGAYLEEGGVSLEAYLYIPDDWIKAHKEVYLDQAQANYLNSVGICSALNFNGWRSWGDNTSIYPASTDVKDRYIPIRRMFNWWGNTFILTYFQVVDNPINLRLIEAIVDSENIRANGFQAKGMIASGKIDFDIDENPITDILNGQIHFRQMLALFPPMEAAINTLIFDPNALRAYLGGGDING